tara:strand:- start:39226 stop:39411 length:186 start_codon:yes stop_codon:yes gene_type:complete
VSKTVSVSDKNQNLIRANNIRVVCQKKQFEISCFYDKIIEFFTMFAALQKIPTTNIKKKII